MGQLSQHNGRISVGVAVQTCKGKEREAEIERWNSQALCANYEHK